MALPIFDVLAAKRLGAALLYAPTSTSAPLANLGTTSVGAAELKNGAALQSPGLAKGIAATALNGTTQYVNTKAGWGGAGSRTFVGMANRTDTTNSHMLWGTSPTGVEGPNMFIVKESTTVKLSVGGGVAVEWTGAWPGTAQTVLYAVSIDNSGKTATLYINGVSQGAKALGASFANTAGVSFEIGARQTGQFPFKGSLLPFAMFESVLTLAESELLFPQRVAVIEHPPMRQYILATTPDGSVHRWGEDERSAERGLLDVSDEDSVPGGYKQLTGTLPRKSGVDYSDMQVGTHIEVFGAGGQQVGEYRLERAPISSGDYLTMDPAAFGYQGHLADDNTAQGIPLDADMSAWGEPSPRFINAFKANRYNQDGQVALRPAGDPAGAGVPALAHSFGRIANNGGTEPDVAVSVYDSNGIELGKIAGDFVSVKNVGAEAAWNNQLVASSDDQASTFDILKDFDGASTTQWGFSINAARFYLILQDYYANAFSADGNWEAQWRSIKIQDRSGIPIYGTWPSVGVLASDVVAYALRKWAPLLRFSTEGVSATIKPSEFPIPHLTFKEPGPISKWIDAANRFELREWAVWNKRTFYMNSRGEREGRRRWRARIQPTQLKDAGQQMDRVWNGVLVEFEDFDGTTKIVGPTGSGLRVTDSRLVDTDPLNPANQITGLRRWTTIRMKRKATFEGAIRTGQRFLEMTKLLDGSGEATIVGYVEDADTSTLCPYYSVHSGDLIEFIDASFSGPRYIVNVVRSRQMRSATVTLDAPPDSVEALMERLDVEFTAAGL